MSATRRTALGILASLSASVLFAVMFYLAGRASSTAEVLFAWRILAAPIVYVPLLAGARIRASVRGLWQQLRTRWWLPVAFLLIAMIINFGSWLFMWAPRNGHALDSSLGFLLLPIALVLASRIFLRSHVSRAQWLVVGLASVAVAVKILATPELGWVTIAVVATFSVYFIGRTRLKLSTLTAHAVETVLAVPLAILFLLREPGWTSELWLLAAVGFASVAAMAGYVGASALLPMPVFGLLSYVEPILLVAVAFILGERMLGADVVVYAIQIGRAHV